MIIIKFLHVLISTKPPCQNGTGIRFKTFDIDWQLMSDKEAEWMEYWDNNIKGRGK